MHLALTVVHVALAVGYVVLVTVQVGALIVVLVALTVLYIALSVVHMVALTVEVYIVLLLVVHVPLPEDIKNPLFFPALIFLFKVCVHACVCVYCLQRHFWEIFSCLRVLVFHYLCMYVFLGKNV